jgi:murein DD-endopeptidase MepM/ murein hydrolase activator NlpD
LKKNLSIILVPHDDSKTRQYQLSYRLMYVLLALCVLTLLVVLVFIFTYGNLLRRANQASTLESQNRQLIDQYAQVDSLRDELVRLQAMSIQVKKMLGLNLSQQDSLLVVSLSPVVKAQVFPDENGYGSVEKDQQQLRLKAFPTLWPIKGYVTRRYNSTGGEKSDDYHPGIDIAAQRGTPILACADGIVVTVGWDETYGNMIVVDHGYGIYTLYGHNSRNLVKEGERVTRGQTIAFVGSTGKSSAPHLHFEIRENGIPVDPEKYLLD